MTVREGDRGRKNENSNVAVQVKFDSPDGML